MKTFTDKEVAEVVASFQDRVHTQRHEVVGSVELRGKLFSHSADSITLIAGELVLNAHLTQIAEIRIVKREDCDEEIALRIKPDARIVMETSVEPGLVKGMLTGEVFLEVMKPGMRTFGYCDTQWCCRGACWCGIGDCGAAEADYVPGTKFRQSVDESETKKLNA